MLVRFSDHPITEGEVAFDAPGGGKPSTTWYKIVGDLANAPHPPLIAVHGGPGAGHEYLIPLVDLLDSHGIPIIFYDQIGCSRSTHFREKKDNANFWTIDLYIAELDNLIDHLGLRERGFFILGQSWGAVFTTVFASRKPRGLKKLINSSGPASNPLAVEGERRLLLQLPHDIQEIIADCERRGDYEGPEWQRASAEFFRRFICRMDPLPDYVLAAFQHLQEDRTAALTMLGPSEFTIIGSLKNWEGWQEAHQIEADVLLINGRYDEVQDIAMAPWFKHIPRVRWITFDNAAHLVHVEARERFMQVCADFLVG